MEEKTGISYKPGDRNYDLYKLACKVTARRFFPNFLNLDATFNQHENGAPTTPTATFTRWLPWGAVRVFENRYGEDLGRTRQSQLLYNQHRAYSHQMYEYPGQGGRIARFFSRLDDVLDITARQLCDRFDFQKTALVKQFPCSCRACG